MEGEARVLGLGLGLGLGPDAPLEREDRVLGPDERPLERPLERDGPGDGRRAGEGEMCDGGEAERYDGE